MISKTQALCKIALEVVKRFNEGTLAGPGDSRSIMELEQFAKEILETFEDEPKKRGVYTLLCSCGCNDCEPGYVMCPECIARDNDE
jgi:hypothetical protein